VASIEMPTSRDHARPWHLSNALVGHTSMSGRPGAPRTPSDHTDPSVEEAEAGRPSRRTMAPTHNWSSRQRAVTWMHRVLAALKWRRRRVAQRTLRWFDRHPEFRDVLADGGVRELARYTVKAAKATRAGRRSRTAHRHPYLQGVDVPSGLDITGLSGSIALAGVELSSWSSVAPRHRANFTDPLIEILPVDSSPRTSRLQLLDAIDIAVWNPWWFRPSPFPETTLMSQLPQGPRRRHTRARLTVANRSKAVVCDDVSAASPAVTARSIAQLAASGAPLVGDISDPVAALLGPDVTDLIRAAQHQQFDDNDWRERYSVSLRRAALDAFSPRGRWQLIGASCGSHHTATPSVTVLLASNRPDDVIDAARQIAAQSACNVQLVVGLHGSHMSRQLDDQLANAFTGDLVVRHFSDELNLGQVMNALTAEADGELVAKWDDDDWYDSRHLADLITALEYSGADLVARAAEFVYLESLDLTVRRFATGSERWSTTVAGGTMLLPRVELQRVGWADAPRRIDRLLIDALEDRSGRIYRTHGFGYVLRRRGAALSSHTWQAGDAYFLRQSVDQRSGLDLAFAGFSIPSHAAAVS
jgi:hypothetical protein